MAKRSQFDIDGDKLREMGLDPDRMTIRERFEALGGVPEGSSLVPTPQDVPAGEKSRTTQKKRPSESVSAAFSTTHASRNPFSVVKPCKCAKNGSDDAKNTCSVTEEGGQLSMVL